MIVELSTLSGNRWRYTVHLGTRMNEKLVHLSLASGRPVNRNVQVYQEFWYT